MTNNVAERGVKMASDYATLLTKDDTMRAWILQGVEKSRRTYPNFKKETINVEKKENLPIVHFIISPISSNI